MATVLIIGCGDIGSRLAKLLAGAGHTVHALRRSDRPVDGAALVRADVRQPFTLALASVDYVVIALAPDESSPEAYAQTYLHSLDPIRAALQPYALKKVFFVSSTSVYGEASGEWVDEDTPPRPRGFNGEILRAAEQRAHLYWPTTVVRFGGIYGEGRNRLIRWVESGKPVTTGQWTNRIHAADAAGLLAFLLEKDHEGITLDDCYLGVDDCPSLQENVLDWLATELDLPPVPKVAGDGESQRRIRNGRIRALGFSLRYPDFRAGYRAVLASG